LPAAEHAYLRRCTIRDSENKADIKADIDLTKHFCRKAALRGCFKAANASFAKRPSKGGGADTPL
jgi:hypothetical protein